MATFSVASKQYSAGPHVVGPFVMPSNVNTIQINFTVAQPDLSDNSLTLDCVLELFDISSQQWLFNAGFAGWQGGLVSRQTGQPIQPSLIVNGVVEIAGQQTRLTITPNHPITTAVSATTS